MSDSKDSDGEQQRTRIPACDTCKSRKIKCDRKDPCSSCVAAKILCRTTKRPPEKRQRVLISSRYENEIAKVNEKLEELSRTLTSLVVSSVSTREGSQATPLSIASGAPGLLGESSQPDKDAPFEGESSFNAHSKRITAAFEAAFGNSPQGVADQTNSEAVQHVQKLLRDAAPIEAPLAEFSPGISRYAGLSQLSLPPMAHVLKMLKVARERSQRFFGDFFLIDVVEFTSLCQKLYFPTEDYSIATFIIVNCGLYFLFSYVDQPSINLLQMTREDIGKCHKIAAVNVDAAIRTMPLFLQPSLENITALMITVAYTMDSSKPSSAWTLVSTAARLCLDMGLHHLRKDAKDHSYQAKKLAFWLVYTFDRSLSLNFGRAPNIHDFDISIDRPNPEDMPGSSGIFYSIWLEFATLQGEVYEKLYSAQAQRTSLDVRVSDARQLGARLLPLHQRFMAVDFTDSDMPDIMRENQISSEIVTCSLLTLIYRIIPASQLNHPLQFCEECVTYARKALHAQNDAWFEIERRDGEAWRSFINWTLLFVPFIPFIVVFGNAVAQANYDDLALLERFVNTLQTAAMSSPSVERLRDACMKFHGIASTYLAQLPQQTNAQLAWQKSNNSTAPSGMGVAFGHPPTTDIQFTDFSMSQQDWDGMLDEWDLGIGAENAREMSSFFEQYMTSNTGSQSKIYR